MTNDELLKQVLADATAKAQKLAEREQEKLRTDRKTILANWRRSQKARRDAEHEAKIKTGRELVDAFIQEVSGAYLRLASDENKESLQTLRILFCPGKSDQATACSVGVLDGTKRISTFFKASLEQMRQKEIRDLEKLRAETGFNGSSSVEMMEEISRLHSKIASIKQEQQQLTSIAEAAQQVLLARANNEALEPTLENLETQFVSPKNGSN